MSDILKELEAEGSGDAPVFEGTVKELEPGHDYPIEIDRFDAALIEEMRSSSPGWQNVEEARSADSGEDFPKAMDTLFASLWKPHPVRNENLTERGEALKTMLDAAESIPEWKQFRQHTILDEVSATIGTTVLGTLIQIPEPGEDPDKVRRNVRKGLQKAQQEVEEIQTAETALWGEESMENRGAVSNKRRIELAKNIKTNWQFRRIAKLVGRFRMIADQQHRRRVTHGQDELADIGTGDDLRYLLPQEYIGFLNPKLRLLFLKDFVERNLLQYEFDARESVGQGPIVVRIDISGSMGNTLPGASRYGIPEGVKAIEWAIAAGLALAVVAKKESRDLNIGLFDTQMKAEWTFWKGKLEPEEVLQLASTTVGGGTDFEVPLQSALDRICSTAPEDKGFEKADIVFITDDACNVSSTFLERYKEEKERHNIKTYGIQIGSAGKGTVASFADKLIHIGNMNEGHAALETVFSV